MTPAAALPWLAVADAATRGALVALLLLLGALLWRDRRRVALAPVATVGAALSAGLVVQVVFGVPSVDLALPLGWLALPIGLSVANSMLFWLFAQALFDDDFRLRPWHAALWAAVVAIGALGAVFCGPVWVPAPTLADPRVLLAALKGWAPLVFGLLALWVAVRQWQADLVEGRRRVRGVVVVAGVIDTLAMVGARLATGQGRVTPLAAWLDVALLLAIVALVAWHLLRLGDLGLFAAPAPAVAARIDEPANAATPADVSDPGPAGDPADQPAGDPVDDPADLALADALAQAMAADALYRDDGLSVARLADHLRVPEYRLRRVINQRLGFRNFNAYVNGFRLAAARAALADPQRRDVPVLTLALEAGFGSIGPFNRAFKAETGLTPSDFRRQALAPLADS